MNNKELECVDDNKILDDYDIILDSLNLNDFKRAHKYMSKYKKLSIFDGIIRKEYIIILVLNIYNKYHSNESNKEMELLFEDVVNIEDNITYLKNMLYTNKYNMIVDLREEMEEQFPKDKFNK